MVWTGALQEGKHVGGCLAEVVIGADFGERDGVWEPINCEGVANAKSAGDVALVALVVFSGWADVPAINTAGCHVGAFIRGDVDDNAGARWCKGTPVEVKDAVEARIGGEPGLAARGAKEVQRDVSLWHEQIPFGEREFGVAKSETRTEMVLPGLDSTFGRVAAMAVWRNALEVNVVLLEGLLELVRIITCLAPASDPRCTRLALPRLLPVVDCITSAAITQAVAGSAEALELFVIPARSFVTTRA